MSAYAKGKIAQMMTWNSFFFDLEDENKSLVKGLTGYTKSPGQGKTSLAGSWIAGIRKGTSHLEHASQFIKWWTSRETSEKLVPIGLSSPRSDILRSDTLGVKFPWLLSTHLNFEASFLRPRSTDYRSVSNDLSKTFTRWVAGQISQAEASSQLFDGFLKMNKLTLATAKE
jgi:ABC-type glycerol-3-phosphate transport system substrate-binding protein